MAALRNWIGLIALCSAATPSAAENGSSSPPFDVETHARATVDEVLKAVEDCMGATRLLPASGESDLEALGWAKKDDIPQNLERSAPISQGLIYYRRGLYLFVSKQGLGPKYGEITTCRIVGLLDTSVDHSGLTLSLQRDLGFLQMSRSSKFALRNPSISDKKLADFFETDAHILRVKFEPDSTFIGVNIVVSPNL